MLDPFSFFFSFFSYGLYEKPGGVLSSFFFRRLCGGAFSFPRIFRVVGIFPPFPSPSRLWSGFPPFFFSPSSFPHYAHMVMQEGEHLLFFPYASRFPSPARLLTVYNGVFAFFSRKCAGFLLSPPSEENYVGSPFSEFATPCRWVSFFFFFLPSPTSGHLRDKAEMLKTLRGHLFPPLFFFFFLSLLFSSRVVVSLFPPPSPFVKEESSAAQRCFLFPPPFPFWNSGCNPPAGKEWKKELPLVPPPPRSSRRRDQTTFFSSSTIFSFLFSTKGEKRPLVSPFS